jgi:hypothetical protein
MFAPQFRRFVQISIGLILFVVLLNPSNASPSQEIAVVTSYWRYEFDPGSSFPHRVYVAAEIRNTSGQYLKNIAVCQSPPDVYHP